MDRAESQAKLLQDHISLVEDNFSALLQNFAAITRKSGKLRDKGDLLAKSLNDYATHETPSLKSSLAGCAECFAAIEDYREAKVTRLEAKVIQPLTDYGAMTKKAREELRTRRAAFEKEITKQRNLDRISIREPADASRRHRVSKKEITYSLLMYSACNVIAIGKAGGQSSSSSVQSCTKDI
jgi:hypothetical protein